MKIGDLRVLITETKNNKELGKLIEELLYRNDARRETRFIKDSGVRSLLESLEVSCENTPYTENRAFALSKLSDLDLIIADTSYTRPPFKIRNLKILIAQTKNNKDLGDLTNELLALRDSNGAFSLQNTEVRKLLEYVKKQCMSEFFKRNRAFALSQLPDLNLVIADTLYRRPVFITAPPSISDFYSAHMKLIELSSEPKARS